eukprot:g10003.t1
MGFPSCQRRQQQQQQQQQQEQQQHGEEIPASRSSCRKMDTNTRHSSAPPQQRHRALLAKAARHPWIFLHQRRRHGRPAAPRHRDSVASSPAAGGAPLAGAPAADSGRADGPLSFPAPKFSAAVRVAVVQGGSFILTSRPTGRRWMVLGSCRKCQFGEVLRAVELKEGAGATGPSEYFAIKELSLEKLRGMEGRTHENPLKEVAALQYLSGQGHPNVLTCTEALQDKKNLYIVTPFFSGGEIFDAVADRGRFEESEARPLFRQALEGLLHLKRRGVCHRDVSLENLLLAEGGVVKVVDFGLALRIPQAADGAAKVIPPQGRCGKQYYMSPEVLAPSPAGFDGFAVDVWACGIALFIMLAGVPPFEIALPSQDRRCHVVSVEERLRDLLLAWAVTLSPEAVDLIQSCLLLAPERRPSLEDYTKMSSLWRTSATSMSVFLLALASCQAAGPDTIHEPSPAYAVEVSVEASSQVMHMDDPARRHPGWLLVHGTNFNTQTTLIFDPPLPESSFWQQMLSPTEIGIVKIRGPFDHISWRPEPGPLKVVAIQVEGEPVQPLNPEGGGVVVAEIVERPIVQDEVAPQASNKHPPTPLIEPDDSEVAVLSEDTVGDFIRADLAMVQFYAWWCPHSQKLFPEYTKASIELKRLDPDIKLGKVDLSDATTRSALGRRFDVRGYPTIKIFRNGVEMSNYNGSRDAAGIVDYLMSSKAKEDGMVDPPAPKKSPSPPTRSLPEPEDSAVSVLSKDTIDDFIQADFAVVDFYIPWSVHCAKMRPLYTEASIALRRLDPDIKLGKINMDDPINRALSERFGLVGYPNIKIFRNGVVSDYTGRRNVEGLVDSFLAEKAKQDGMAPPASNKPQPHPLVEPEDSEVSVLSGNTIDGFIQSDFAVVQFFSWDRYSQNLSLEYAKASIELKRIDPDIKLGKIDLSDDTNRRALLKYFFVRAYPTIKIFRNGVEVSDYKDSRAAGGIVDYLKSAKAYQMLQDSAVSVLSKDTIYDFIQADFAVVHFYTPQSGQMCPYYSEFSIALRRLDPEIKLGEINLKDGTNPRLDRRLGFPSIKIFRNGVAVSSYGGRSVTEGFLQTLFGTIPAEKAKQGYEEGDEILYVRGKNPPQDGVVQKVHLEDEMPYTVHINVTGREKTTDHAHLRHKGPKIGLQTHASSKPASPPLVEPEDSEVSVLSEDTIDGFIQSDFAVVQFYTRRCVWCQKLSPEYTKASIKLKRLDPDIKLGKIDMTDDKRALQRRFQPLAYPTIKIFRNGVEMSDYNGSRDAAGIVDTLTEKAKEMRNTPNAINVLSINASATEVFPSLTQELLITGSGFSEADPPELRFEHALGRGIKTEVVNRTTIRMEILADSSGWTILDGHVGPLKIKRIITGAGTEEIVPGVTVATVMPNFMASESHAQVY